MKNLFLSFSLFLNFFILSAQKIPDYSIQNLDLVFKSDSSYKLKIFPLFNFEYLYSKQSHFINARGLGFNFESGNLEIYSSFYDAQISNIKGTVSDYSLPGLNYVRFKGENNNFNQAPSSNIDFDAADSYIKYSFNSGFFRFGKYPFIQNEHHLNSLIFNGTNGSFTHSYFNYKTALFEYEFLLGFLKHLNGIGSLSDKAIAYHKFQLNLFNHFKFYAFEAVLQKTHSIKVEYLNPFIFLRSSDHYNFSADNAVIAVGLEYYSENFNVFSEILIDDMDISKFGTGWFRNKTSGIVGTAFNTQFYEISNKFKLETVFINPFTYSHRDSKLNFTQFGSSLGPELGPNSLKIQFQDEIMLTDYPLKFIFGYELLIKGLSTSEIIVGDDISVGHPDIFTSPSPKINGIPVSLYPEFLSGRKIATDVFSVKTIFMCSKIDFFINILYSTQNFVAPIIAFEKGKYVSAGMKYNFYFFDKVRMEFW